MDLIILSKVMPMQNIATSNFNILEEKISIELRILQNHLWSSKQMWCFEWAFNRRSLLVFKIGEMIGSHLCFLCFTNSTKCSLGHTNDFWSNLFTNASKWSLGHINEVRIICLRPPKFLVVKLHVKLFFSNALYYPHKPNTF